MAATWGIDTTAFYRTFKFCFTFQVEQQAIESASQEQQEWHVAVLLQQHNETMCLRIQLGSTYGFSGIPHGRFVGWLMDGT